jgi:hypothetical protein
MTTALEHVLGVLGEDLGLVVDDDGGMLPSGFAAFDHARRYRYLLARTWDGDLDPAVWLMCNPSTADAFVLDATLRRCRAFSHTWGHGGMVILNAFAFRATQPDDMKAQPDPVGPVNDAVIAVTAAGLPGAPWIVGWGANGGHLGRDRQVAAILAGYELSPSMLAVTKDGHPGHPLRLRADAKPTPWNLPNAVYGASCGDRSDRSPDPKP